MRHGGFGVVTTPSGAVTAEPARAQRSWTGDAIICVVVALAVAAVTWKLYAFIDPQSLGPNQYFQSDLERVWAVLTNRWSPYHERSRLHPLFSLVNTSSVYGLRRVLGLETVTAVRAWTVLSAAVWAAVFYVAARLLLLTRFDAVLVVTLGVISAAGVCWLPVPETYTLGSATILACVIAAAMYERRPVSEVALTGTTVLSLSMTFTNALAAGVLLLRTRGFARALQIGANAFVVMMALQIIQNYVYRETHFALEGMSREHRFVLDRSAGGVLNKAAAMFGHGLIMPTTDTVMDFDTKTTMVTFQRSGIGSSGAIGWTATLLWWAMLAWGSRVLFRRARTSISAAVCGGAAIAQVLLHLVYGDETFLYTLNVVPLLLLVAAAPLVWSSRRVAARSLLILLCACTLLNNAQQAGDLKHVLRSIAVHTSTGIISSGK